MRPSDRKSSARLTSNRSMMLFGASGRRRMRSKFPSQPTYEGMMFTNASIRPGDFATSTRVRRSSASSNPPRVKVLSRCPPSASQVSDTARSSDIVASLIGFASSSTTMPSPAS